MKIYISENQAASMDHISINNVVTMENSVSNSEATSIIVDNFLSCFYLSELETLISKILNKARIGCHVTIIEKDIDLTLLAASRGDISMKDLNEELFSNDKTTKSLLQLEVVKKIVEDNKIKVYQVYTDYSSRSFVIKGRRLK